MTSPHTHTRGTHRGHPRVPSAIHKALLSRHTGIGWSGGGGGSGTRGRTDSDGAEQRPPGRPLLCLPERAVCAQLERGQVQGSVAARGRAAAVASRRAARARRGGQVIGRRVMGRRVTAPSDRRRRADRRSAAADLEGVRSATVGVGGRPSCGEEGGRQVRVVRVALHRPVERHSSRDRACLGDEKPVGPVGGRTRFVSRFQKRLRAQRNFGFATKSVPSWKWG